MLSPRPGELLHGVRRELAEQVLPELPPGAAARQLRAALHLLARLERSWDLLPACVAEDNADLRTSLGRLREQTGLAVHLPGHADLEGTPVVDVHDPHLRAALQENTALQSALEQWQQQWRDSGRTDPDVDRALLDLHTRRTIRERRAGGLDDLD